MVFDLNQPKHVHVDQRLQNEPIIWLGTVRPDGRPHLVPVWFLWHAGEILMFSKPSNQKIRNLQAQPHVTLALEAAQYGKDIAIIEGTATLPTSVDEAILPPYEAKYRQMIAAMGWQFAQMMVEYRQLIRVTPTRLIAW
jgi:PPOX class probable F420-dependent enzyme